MDEKTPDPNPQRPVASPDSSLPPKVAPRISEGSFPPPPPDRPPTSSRRRIGWIIGGTLLVLVIALIVWHPWGAHGRHGGPDALGPPGGPPGGPGPGGPGGGRHGGPMAANQTQAVRVAKATIGEIPVVFNALGTVTPLATVTVHSQISGNLMKIGFTEGQHVKQGDFLAQVDPRPYEIQLRQAEGTLRKDQALLRQARLDLQRYKTLVEQDSVARQTYDSQVSLVQQYEGTVQSDQASVDTYKLDLVYARVTAPVSGRVGLRQVDIGNYVTTSDTNGLVVITQTQPMSVIFTLPEDNIPAVMDGMSRDGKLSASAFDRTDSHQIALGSLATLDNQIDTTTGTVKLRAMFANQDEELFPNQFVNIRLLVNVIRNATIVPSSAVQTGSIGSYVYLVKPDDTVTVRKITIGQVDGERTQVTQGLTPGDTVVTDGVDRLREGAKVAPSDLSGGASTSGASGAATASDAATASAASGTHAAHRHRHAASDSSAANTAPADTLSRRNA
ncbi:MdtA/MuxA family multidrug efflux RND transporter periplasmic adaptor subunit [Robbsia andropogonis]|uniref:MdtA/MuxA family multidrug efflux RND transporter periplasmic adaptor subunit n=1 Tax=Robbsia andropogonis TaxID=28092 RepID=UPI003D257C07